MSIAAQHSWDARRRERVNNGHVEDREILDQVVALYRAANPQGPPPSADLPSDAAALRRLLGGPFVRAFAETTEEKLGVDVIRIPELGTDYSLRIGERGVIVLATQASWFRSNWSLAHELAHLALCHHAPYESSHEGPKHGVQKEERQTDRFAASLLLPAEALDRIAALPDERSTAQVIWELGVSTEAVRNQLRRFKRSPNEFVTSALAQSTPKLLRNNRAAITGGQGVDPIVGREQAASARRFPVPLLSALQAQIDIGAASPVMMAWALDVPVNDIDFPEASDDIAAYERMLEERPSIAEWSPRMKGATVGR